ncbi:hypothetical protein IFM89_002212 [Coptis chinensis]|uniref:Uncharacterized protein n=1 Tax=Coptis chinensis TaxID=261450 RepID=A0A835I7E3_9MAGN|nr:hypothetical protein IFM89_002212 [Coptis chinensis]
MTSSRPSLPNSSYSSMFECVLRFQVSTTAANVLETEISCECYNLFIATFSISHDDDPDVPPGFVCWILEVTLYGAIYPVWEIFSGLLLS